MKHKGSILCPRSQWRLIPQLALFNWPNAMFVMVTKGSCVSHSRSFSRLVGSVGSRPNPPMHRIIQRGHRLTCEEAGVKLNTTVPYHPASNGVAERTIRVLTNAVCTMLHDSGLPKTLWAEAFNTATYIRRRTPTCALEGRTPHEMVYDVKPDLANLRAFGAPCPSSSRAKG